ncbi:MAG: UDP-N-acetylmuramoyl-L-alanine--D-glutamate ligase [Candidatus Liptonbacteria bacterium]|nr:UDP-N-acetylmuramoyl-L-alanine--D-glutamate ligase [Candidatus Liptonbacteria bacterium]
MKIAILGFAREGRSVLKFLQKDREFKKSEIWILDKNPNSVSGINRVPGIRTGKNYLKNLHVFDVVFRSPGIPYLSPEIQKAERKGTEILSATKIFFERCPGTIIGITGTKGKGTTSTILYKMLKAHSTSSGQAGGRKVFLAGNIGRPALDMLSKIDKKSLVVFELSSFQLQDMKMSPEIAVVLDIFPDHLDAHKNVREYYAAKANITKYQSKKDRVFSFKNNSLSGKMAANGKGLKIVVDEKKFGLFSSGDLKIDGPHNFKNAVMAATVAKSLGVSNKAIVKTIRNFRGMEHRLEFVRKIKLQIHSHTISRNLHYVYFYNDSASTNPQTAAAAMESFPKKEKILVAGGQDKNLSYAPLKKAIEKSGTKFLVLFGENKSKIGKSVRGSGAEIAFTKNLAEAIKESRKRAEHLAARKDSDVAVLFSPASTSFDMFENYEDRGDKFKKIVKQLK